MTREPSPSDTPGQQAVDWGLSLVAASAWSRRNARRIVGTAATGPVERPTSEPGQFSRAHSKKLTPSSSVIVCRSRPQTIHGLAGSCSVRVKLGGRVTLAADRHEATGPLGSRCPWRLPQARCKA